MTNFKITYTCMDSNHIKIVYADSAEQAKTFLDWIEDASNIVITEASEAEAEKSEAWNAVRVKAFWNWLDTFIEIPCNELTDRPEITEKLEADGWERHEEYEDVFDMTFVSYTKGNRIINL